MYSTANDPQTRNDPQNGPQLTLDLKWSPCRPEVIKWKVKELNGF